MEQSLCIITSNVEVSPGIHLMWLEAQGIACLAQPGQFVTVRCEELTLRRPLSIYQIFNARKAKQSQIGLLFKIVGEGTFWLSQRQPGDKIDILGPLGNGFNIESEAKNLLLVAGGIGIAPLVFLSQHTSPRHSITLIHGANTATQIYPFSSPQSEVLSHNSQQSNLPGLAGEVQFIPVTEDGSMGRKGRVTDILPDFLDWADQIYACGPVDMYKAMAEILLPDSSLASLDPHSSLPDSHSSLRAERSNPKIKKCQVSLEVRMGCGFGACYGCTINTRKGLKQVCRDGPIFELSDVLWKELKI